MDAAQKIDIYAAKLSDPKSGMYLIKQISSWTY